jgi:ribosomal protein S18 acetylase RimI-like enzyme
VAEKPPHAKWVVEELSAQYDRSAFSCGHDSLDEFLKNYAGQNQKSGVSRTFIVRRPDEQLVIGYYSISAGSVVFDNLSEQHRKRLPRYPVPVAHLGRLAVDRTAQGQGLGEYLLIDAFRRIQIAAESIGIHAIEVVAIDDAAKRFYLKYGFTELRDDPHHLYMSMKMVKALGLV